MVSAVILGKPFISFRILMASSRSFIEVSFCKKSTPGSIHSNLKASEVVKSSFYLIRIKASVSATHPKGMSMGVNLVS